MRWKKVDGGGGVEDRRGEPGSGGGLGGGMGGIPFPVGKAGGGLGMILVLLVVLLFASGQCSGAGNSGLTPSLDPSPPADTTSAPPEGDTAAEFTKFVNQDVQALWEKVFTDSGRTYTRTPVVLFTSGTLTGCGPASSATGPFYCPADNKVYLDLSFFNELSRRFGAPGDFAAAYVIAHEIGHHVQDELGIEAAMREKQQEDPQNANAWSVALELQADCFAGVWAHSTYERGMLEEGDLDEGLNAAAAVGDDRLGARSREQWTHGSSELRTKWFRRGFDSGKAGDCDTFQDVSEF
ncbi:MAG: neutral zinc metallopeptidase [Gaiellales bacterium]